MNIIKTLMETTDDGSLAELTQIVHRRLLGSYLDIPYDIQAGEQPEDVLIEVATRSHDQKALSNLRHVIKHLAKHDVAPAIKAACYEERHDIPEILLIERFLRLVSYTQDVDIADSLLSWASDIYSARNKSRQLSSLFLAIIKVGVIHYPNHAGIHAFCAVAIGEQDTCNDIARITAYARPTWFIKELLGPYVKSIVSDSEDGQDSARFELLSDTLRGAVEAAKGCSDAEKRDITRCVKSMISAYANNECGKKIHDAVISALALGRWMASDTLNIDDTFWKRRRVTAPLDAMFSSDWKPTYKKLQSLYGDWAKEHKEEIPKTVIVNTVPYTEQVFLLLWSLLIQQIFKCTLKFHNTGWATIPDDLKNEYIQVAIYNNRIWQQIPGIELHQSRCRLFTYRNYEVVVSTDWLRKCLSRDISESSMTAIRSVLEGTPMGEKAEGLVSVLKGARVSVPYKTDIHESVEKLLARIGLREAADVTMIDKDAKYAIEEFLDDKADILCGGANDAAYLVKCFGRRVKLLAVIGQQDAGTDNMIFTLKSYYDEHRGFVDNICRLWDRVVDLWAKMAREPGEHARWIQALREYLIVQFNKTTRGGNVDNFQDLISITKAHNILHTSDEKPGQKLRVVEPLRGVGR